MDFVSLIKKKLVEHEFSEIVGKWRESIFQLMKTQSVIKKYRKVSFWDNIVGEHINFSGKILHKLLTILYNSIIKFEVIPDHLKKV